MSQKAAEKNPENWIKQRAITPVKVSEAWRNQNWSELCQDNIMYQISSKYLKSRQRKVQN